MDTSDLKSDTNNTVESEDLVDTDDEIDNAPIPASLAPVPGQHVLPHQPLVLDVVDQDHGGGGGW